VTAPQGIEATTIYSIKPIPTPTSDTRITLLADDSLGSAPLFGVDEALLEGVLGPAAVLVEFGVVLPNARAFAKNAW